MNLTPAQVIEKVKKAGIVGAGGAGFPTHVKLNSKVQTLIVNAVSCEPLVNSDFSIITDNPEKLFKAMTIVMDTTIAKEGIIAVKGKHKALIKVIENALAKYNDDRIKIQNLDDFYPAGDEFILVYEVTGKVIPERALPLEVGCLVQNVTTLIQIADAIEDMPLINRIVTVTGEVKYPVDLILPLGITFKEAIDLAGGATCEDFKVISGGPMMGKVVNDINTETVTKTCGMILVLPSDHITILRKEQPLSISMKLAKSVCCQCSLCSDLCPRALIGHPLSPHKIMRTISYNLSEPAENVISSYLCSECGLCTIYSCPMGLTPHRINSEIKDSLAKSGFKFQKILEDYEVDDEVRNARKVPTSRLLGRLNLKQYYNLDIMLNKTPVKPAIVKINLQQHIGAKSEPIVKVGMTVKVGDLIADIPRDKLGARIHASISGTIAEINDDEIVIKR